MSGGIGDIGRGTPLGIANRRMVGHSVEHQEQSGVGGVALLGEQVQEVGAIEEGDIGIGAAVKQFGHGGHLGLFITGGQSEEKRRGAGVVTGVEFGAGVQEQIDQFFIAGGQGFVQGGTAIQIDGFDKVMVSGQGGMHALDIVGCDERENGRHGARLMTTQVEDRAEYRCQNGHRAD